MQGPNTPSNLEPPGFPRSCSPNLSGTPGWMLAPSGEAGARSRPSALPGLESSCVTALPPLPRLSQKCKKISQRPTQLLGAWAVCVQSLDEHLLSLA